MKTGHFVTLLTCAALLGACGGGSSNDDNNTQSGNSVPAQPTKDLTNNSDEAGTLAVAAVNSSNDTAATSADQSRLSAFSNLSGLTATAAGSASVKSLIRFATDTSNIAGKASQEVSCSALALPSGTGSCSGSLTMDTNIGEDTVNPDGNIRAGSYIEMRYNQISYTSTTDGLVSISGSIRVTFDTIFTVSPASGTISYVATDLVSTSGGQTYGPLNATYQVVMANGTTTVITDDNRLEGLGLTMTDDNNYVISEGTVMDGYGDAWVEVSYDEWDVVDGIPQTGSRVSIRGSNGTASVVVSSVDNGVVTLQVSLTVDGSTETYDVMFDTSTGQTIIL